MYDLKCLTPLFPVTRGSPEAARQDGAGGAEGGEEGGQGGQGGAAQDLGDEGRRLVQKAVERFHVR